MMLKVRIQGSNYESLLINRLLFQQRLLAQRTPRILVHASSRAPIACLIGVVVADHNLLPRYQNQDCHQYQDRDCRSNCSTNSHPSLVIEVCRSRLTVHSGVATPGHQYGAC